MRSEQTFPTPISHFSFANLRYWNASLDGILKRRRVDKMSLFLIQKIISNNFPVNDTNLLKWRRIKEKTVTQRLLSTYSAKRLMFLERIVQEAVRVNTKPVNVLTSMPG